MFFCIRIARGDVLSIEIRQQVELTYLQTGMLSRTSTSLCRLRIIGNYVLS